MTAPRTARALFLGVGALVAGVAIVHAAPRAWRLEWWQGLLLGSAIYMGIVHRWDREGTAGWLRRAAVFFALLALQAFAYFEWLPATDLRAPFVVLSVWIVTEAMFARSGVAAREVATDPSRRV